MGKGPRPCAPADLSVGSNFDERYPEYKGKGWLSTADVLAPQADCVHSVNDVSRIVANFYPYHTPASNLGVDFETKEIAISGFHDNWGTDKTDRFPWEVKVLPDEALIELRGLLEKYQVVEWPFEEDLPAEEDSEIYYGEGNSYELGLLYKDGTGNHDRRPSSARSRALAEELELFMDKYAPEADFTPEKWTQNDN